MKKKIHRFLIKTVMILFALLLSSGLAHACPTLQLDIGGGTYYSPTETIVSAGDSFTLYAYLIPNNSNKLSDDYYISMAVTPKVGPTGANLGSFTFDGSPSPIQVTDSMTYGIPPLEESLTAAFDCGDLPGHGIFNTYFYEYEFQFSDLKTKIYNTQDDPGGPVGAGTGMYYASFQLNTALLNPEYVIHFDLYNTAIKRGGDIDVTQFAPFSHDAESRHNVPEPMTLIILGLGLVGIAGMKRKFRR
jgi:hypothetical protein